jgi:hypothetical protein
VVTPTITVTRDYDTYEDEDLPIYPPYLFEFANKYTFNDIHSTKSMYVCPIWVGRCREARIELCGAYYIVYTIS